MWLQVYVRASATKSLPAQLRRHHTALKFHIRTMTAITENEL